MPWFFISRHRSHTLWRPQKTTVLMLWVYLTVVSCSCQGMRDKHPRKQLANIRKWLILGSYLDTFHTHPDVSIRLGYELETWVYLSYTYAAVSWRNYNEVQCLIDEYRFVNNSWPSRATVGFSTIYRCILAVCALLSPVLTLLSITSFVRLVLFLYVAMALRYY